jgi:HEPN domain-containing protein
MVVFHCQQSAEKYLKALLQEFGVVIPKIHYLESLLTMLIPHDATLKSMRRILRSLTQFAVDYRYPDEFATTRQMNAALRHAERVRAESRTRLGLTV